MPAPQSTTTPRVLLTMRHLTAMFSASRDAVIDMCERGVLPKPFKLGVTPQSPLRWVAAEVDAAVAALPRVERITTRTRRAKR